MGAFENISEFIERSALTVKSLLKIALETRRCGISVSKECDRPLIIMGNGPSLNDTMRDFADELHSYPSMAVNFAANTDSLYRFKPQYYVIADPAFFADDPYENVANLWKNLNEKVDWPMTLFVPARFRNRTPVKNRNIHVEWFNMVRVEGFDWLEDLAYKSGRGMARPRNVLIVSLMVAMKMGFKTIYVTGADHSWTRTLSVSEENLVVSIQPHFYKDNETEQAHVASVYKDVRMHQILFSFHVAFKAYFTIRRYAGKHGITIYNATPGSFIDAFQRRGLEALRQ